MSDRKPTNVNIRHPAAIERILEEVRAGRARNYSEGAVNLILSSVGRPFVGTHPTTSGEQHPAALAAS